MNQEFDTVSTPVLRALTPGNSPADHLARVIHAHEKSAGADAVYRAATVTGYANISGCTRLIDAGVDHVDGGGTDTYARSANTGGRCRAYNTAFRYAHALAINDRIR